MFRLKKGQDTFQAVDGPEAGRTFERDVEYARPAKGYESLFEPVRTDPKPVPAKTAPVKIDKTKGKEDKS